MSRFVNHFSRRQALGAFAAGFVSSCSFIANGQDEFSSTAGPAGYPDPRVKHLDDRFGRLVLGNTPLQRIYYNANMLWAEGPAWNAVGRYLLWSDIPNNVQHRWLEEDGHVSVMRNPANNSNGNTFDFSGRQISCEHLTRSVVRYEHDGSRTILASRFQGKSLNAPNDVVVHPNGDIWFTDPGYGGLMDYEGRNARTDSVQPYQKEAVYRIDARLGTLHQVTTDIFKPNGLCFSPDYSKLYVADTGASHYKNAVRQIKVWNVKDQTSLTAGRVFTSMTMELTENDKARVVTGNADGIRCDEFGNVWSSAGWVGTGYDGVHVFAAEDGKRIGQIMLPEICSNLCFGGSKGNRLFMAASQSIYAIYTHVRGAEQMARQPKR